MKILIVITLTIALNEGTIPKTFKKCNRKSSDFKRCVVDAVQRAVIQLDKPYKEINLPSLEPLEIGPVSVHGKSGIVSVNQNLKTCKFHGLSQSKIEDFYFDFENKTVGGTAVIPLVVMECQYEIEGAILILPFKGKGNSSIIFKNLFLSYNGIFEEFRKKNRTYLHLVADEGYLDIFEEDIKMQFDNLFHSTKELNDKIDIFLNKNALIMYQDLKTDYNEVIKQKLVTTFNKIFQKISEEEAFD